MKNNLGLYYNLSGPDIFTRVSSRWSDLCHMDTTNSLWQVDYNLDIFQWTWQRYPNSAIWSCWIDFFLLIFFCFKHFAPLCFHSVLTQSVDNFVSKEVDIFLLFQVLFAHPKIEDQVFYYTLFISKKSKIIWAYWVHSPLTPSHFW